MKTIYLSALLLGLLAGCKDTTAATPDLGSSPDLAMPDAGVCSTFATANETFLNTPTISVVVRKSPVLPTDPGLP